MVQSYTVQCDISFDAHWDILLFNTGLQFSHSDEEGTVNTNN
jgi:hypothetical protein